MSQSIRGLMKGKKTGTPRSRGYAVPKNVEREINRPSRGIGKRSDSNRRQRPSTGARALHDAMVTTGKGLRQLEFNREGERLMKKHQKAISKRTKIKLL